MNILNIMETYGNCRLSQYGNLYYIDYTDDVLNKEFNHPSSFPIFCGNINYVNQAWNIIKEIPIDTFKNTCKYLDANMKRIV